MKRRTQSCYYAILALLLIFIIALWNFSHFVDINLDKSTSQERNVNSTAMITSVRDSKINDDPILIASTVDPIAKKSTESEQQKPFYLLDGRDTAIQLQKIQRNLEKAFRNKDPPSLTDIIALRKLTVKLYPLMEMDNLFNDSAFIKWHESQIKTRIQSTTKIKPGNNFTFPFVCPEQSPDKTPQDELSECTIETKMETLVTIVINACEFPSSSTEKLARLLKDFKVSYPKMEVIAACVGKNIYTKTNLTMFEKSKGVPTTILNPTNKLKSDWSAAFRLVETPFVLAAPGINRFSKTVSPLDRMVRVLTETPGVAVVGGAVRNSSRHWKVGCFQSELSNYVLRYQKGYHNSFSECMFCDYVDGPFLTYTSLLQNNKMIRFDSAPSMIFHEFFLNISSSQLSMVCPDVMFYADAAMAGGAEVLKQPTWLPLARKLELNRVLIEYELSHVMHRFSCVDVGINCTIKSSGTFSYSIPVCCREDMLKAFKIWDKFCLNHSLPYNLHSGSLLGAVKMADIIPWKFNTDFQYYDSNFTFIKSCAPIFKQQGLVLNDFHDPVCCRSHRDELVNISSFMTLWTPRQMIHLQGTDRFFLDAFLYPGNNIDQRGRTTLLEVRGMWITGPANPGKYIRERFGLKYLQHQRWQDFDLETGKTAYSPSVFQPCIDPAHHACLDKLPIDGSLAFKIPEW